MNYRLFLILLLMFAPRISGQSEAGVNVSAGGYGMLRTNISVSYDHSYGDLSDGFAARVSYNLFKNEHFTVTANARYSSTTVSLGSNGFNGGFRPSETHLNGIHVYGQTGFTSMFTTRLSGKPVKALAMVNCEWGKGGFARISGIGMGLILLKATASTQFGIGPLVMVNTCSKLPAFLVFMYNHKFNDRWRINLYGGIFCIEFVPNGQNIFSAGADIDVKAFYFMPGDSRLPNKCRFTSTSFRPMVKYRRTIHKNLYFDIQTGVSITMSCRVNGVSGSKEYFDCNLPAAPFIQTGFSYSL